MFTNQVFTDQRFSVKQFTGETLENCRFYRCRFDSTDLSDTVFVDCLFYDDEEQKGCSFQHAKLQDASFKRCDLTMADFKNIQALGCEIREARAGGEAACQPLNYVISSAEQAADRVSLVIESVKWGQGCIKWAVVLVQPTFESFEACILVFSSNWGLAHLSNQQCQ